MKRLFILFIPVFLAFETHATTRYVRPTPYLLANGSSWANASDDLQLMINQSAAGDTIWVAEGTYLPIRPANNLGTISYNNRDNAFVLKADVKIFGGFPNNGAATWVNRDWNLYPTILSGDIGVVNDSTDNCYHVVISAGAVGTACLDGFTITKGNANNNGNIVVNSILINGTVGGGIANSNSSPILTNLTISRNCTTGAGGGIYNYSSSPILTNVTISGNCAVGGGGIQNHTYSSPVLINVTINGNTASSGGGGIDNYVSSPILINVTISGNWASMGGGIYNNAASTNTIIRNSIIWGNTTITGMGHNVYNFYGGTSTYTYSIVEGSSSGWASFGTDLGNNLDVNPLFISPVSASLAPTTAGDYQLQKNSPAICGGNNALYLSARGIANFLGETDLAGNQRLFGYNIDMGAYEFGTIIPDINGIVYVNKSVLSGDGRGDNWTNAAKELADALKAARQSNAVKPDSIREIWVAAATYYPLYNAADGLFTTDGNRDNAFVMVKDVQIYGGFPDNATDANNAPVPHHPSRSVSAARDTRDWHNNSTVLSGDIGIPNNNTDNCLHVVISAGAVGTACLDGFTVTEGYGSIGGSTYITVNTQSVIYTRGAGIFNINSSPNLTNIIISGNTSQTGGAGICNMSSSPTLTNVIISDNTIIAANSGSGGGGGGMYNDDSSPILTNVIICGNRSTYAGGGMSNFYSSPMLTNVVISGNTVTGGTWNSGGDGMFNNFSSPILTNVTISGNNASVDGSGIYNGNSDPQIQNSIIWGNGNGSNNVYDRNSIPQYDYSLVQGNGNIGTNIDVNPLFVAPVSASLAPTTAGDYQLQTNSPALNRGDTLLYKTARGIADFIGETDLAGNPRLNGNNIDMGAFESEGIFPDINGILYVNKNAICSGSGNSWSNPVSELSDALKAAREYNVVKPDSIREIWVAAATYYPLYNAADGLFTTDGNRDNAFVLVKDVQIYGGFPQNANNANNAPMPYSALTVTQARETRDWHNNPTILSGQRDFNPYFTDSNCYHVVISANDVGTACLDGFTITKGNANNNNGNIAVNSISINRNNGGGIHNANSSPTISNIIISENNAYHLGGGMYNNHSSSVFRNMVVGKNAADYGGGIYNDFSSSLIFTDAVISGNTAAINSGGIHNHFSSSTLTNVLISGNTAAIDGGGMFGSFSPSTLINVLISGNVAIGGNGGGMYNTTTSIILANVIVSGNHANNGGGLYEMNNISNLVSQIYNSIIWGNKAANNFDNTYITNPINRPVFTHSLIEGSSGGWANFGTDGGGNIDADPLFVNPVSASLAPTIAGDYQLHRFSPAIYAGDSNLYKNIRGIANFSNETDLAGNPRLFRYNIDMGAYEYPYIIEITPDANGIVYVKKSVSSGNRCGNSWANAAPELADALKTAKISNEITPDSIREIWVAEDTYYPLYHAGMDSINGGRDNAFVLVKDVQVYGGFPQNASNALNAPSPFSALTVAQARNTRNRNTYPTILSGQRNPNPAFTDSNCYHVVISANDVGTACLDGFTITKGNADGSNYDTIFVNSTAIVKSLGGGMYNNSSSPTLTHVTINGNNAIVGGGGICNYAGSSPVLTNVIITKNYGGGMYNYGSSPVLTNVTIANNTATTGGGGICNNAACSAAVRNSIIWGNTTTNGGNNVQNNGTSSSTFTHSLVEGSGSGWANFGINGGNNIDADPLFVNASLENYQIKVASPALNKGDTLLYKTVRNIADFVGETDLAGNPRLFSINIDMGAYECQEYIPDTIFFNPLSFIYNGTGQAPVLSTYSGRIVSDTLYKARNASDLTYSSTKPVNVGNYTVKASLQQSGEYVAVSDTANFEILPCPITITVDNGQSKIYGDPDPIFTYTVNPPLYVPDTFAGILTREAGENIGKYEIQLGTLSAGSNYAITFVEDSFLIVAKEITITVDNGQSKTYGDSDTIFTYTVVPSLIVPDTFTGALAREAGEDIGKYEIQIGTLSAGNNYNLTFVEDSFLIIPKEITVTVDSGQSKTYGDPDPIFTYIANPPLFAPDTFAGALTRTSGENVGAYAIYQGTLSASSNYTIVFIGEDFYIVPKEITVKANGGSSEYGDNPANPGFTATGLVNGETESVLTGLSNSFPIDGTTPVGIYELQVIGTLTNSNYSITYRDTGTWIVDERLLVIKAIDETIDYGQIPLLNYTIVSGTLVNGDVLSGSLYVDNYEIGIHTIEQGTLTAGSNYTIVFEEGTLIVLSTDVSVENVLIDGKNAKREDDQFFAEAECGANYAEVRVICDSSATVKINGIEQNPCTVALPDYGENRIAIIVTAQNGNSKTYTLTINKKMLFEQVVKMRWNNTLTVINNPANNGGFRFTSYTWYRNDREISREQSWSLNSNGEWINPADEFHVILTAEGYSGFLQTCKSKISLRDIPKLYPNPVSVGQIIHIDADISSEDLQNTVIEIYNAVGQLIETLQPTSLWIPINNQYSAGIYIFVLKGNDGLRKEMKVIVQ